MSYGTLPLSDNIAVAKTSENEITFTWDPSTVDEGKMDDQIMLLAYDIVGGKEESTTTGQFRKTGTDTLKLTGKLGTVYHIYAAFSAADRSRQSDSIYLGTITK